MNIRNMFGKQQVNIYVNEEVLKKLEEENERKRLEEEEKKEKRTDKFYKAATFVFGLIQAVATIIRLFIER